MLLTMNNLERSIAGFIMKIAWEENEVRKIPHVLYVRNFYQLTMFTLSGSNQSYWNAARMSPTSIDIGIRKKKLQKCLRYSVYSMFQLK